MFCSVDHPIHLNRKVGCKVMEQAKSHVALWITVTPEEKDGNWVSMGTCQNNISLYNTPYLLKGRMGCKQVKKQSKAFPAP